MKPIVSWNKLYATGKNKHLILPQLIKENTELVNCVCIYLLSLTILPKCAVYIWYELR